MKTRHPKNIKRWKSSAGRPYEDIRNWPKYTEELVFRGEFLLDLDWVENWDKELEEMNLGKRGRPYEFPESLIELQAVWSQLINLRAIEGVTRKLVKFSKLPNYNDYTTIDRRIKKVDTSFELPKTGFCSTSSDGSGMKMNQAGEYRYDKYGRKKKKKWLKVTITANPLTKELLDMDVYVDGEGPSESDISMEHLNYLWSNNITVDKFWGDGAFDVLELFNLLEQHDTESAIPPRDNASKNSNGSMRRLREVFEYQTNTWADWARQKGYGKRWLGTEGIFSAVKRIYGEKTKSKNVENMYKEIKRRFWAYETIRKYAKAQT